MAQILGKFRMPRRGILL